MKRVFEHIREGSISAGEMKLMLLWMDKVRVGLWLLTLTLGKKAHGIAPNFQIGQRLGLADHLVRVFRYKTTAEGIALVGSDSDAFYMMPSVLGLIVRDVVILSVSAGGFLQECMRLVAPKKVIQPDGEKIGWSFGSVGSGYDPTWATSLFRFNQPRFFQFHYVTDHEFEHKTDVLYTDREGALEELDGHTRIEVPELQEMDTRTKLKFMLEVAELQRVLLGTFIRFGPDATVKNQVKRAQRSSTSA